jgi:sugar lactone lactonase YvrE
MTRELSLLADGGAFFESPRWHDGRWWLSDFYTHQVLAVAPDGRSEKIATVDAQPGGLGWLPDGSMLVLSRQDHRLLRCDPNGTMDVVADLTDCAKGSLNEMVVDGAGRAWIGDIGFDVHRGEPFAPTTLKRVDPNGDVSVVADDVFCPNGAVVTPDGATLIVGESYAARYSAFTIQPDGMLTDRYIWAELEPVVSAGTEPRNAMPDGCCLDAEGCLWVSEPISERCIRVTKGGAVVDEIAAPAGTNVFACMLGGVDGTTLLVCVAPDWSAATRINAQDAAVLTTTVDVPGAGFP